MWFGSNRANYRNTHGYKNGEREEEGSVLLHSVGYDVAFAVLRGGSAWADAPA